ncbi:MAG: hypothetical protein LBF92_05930 [Synergistaceae bacterium]|jgi:hypothetical protein|nr:hypothetical protein [Synergistaceae bacterium]
MRRAESPIYDVLRHRAPRSGPFRLASIALCLSIPAVCALLAASALAHANGAHEHDGLCGCLACALAAAEQSLLWGASLPAWRAIFSSCALLIALYNLKASFAWAYFQTLTALKIQLNR